MICDLFSAFFLLSLLFTCYSHTAANPHAQRSSELMWQYFWMRFFPTFSTLLSMLWSRTFRIDNKWKKQPFPVRLCHSHWSLDKVCTVEIRTLRFECLNSIWDSDNFFVQLYSLISDTISRSNCLSALVSIALRLQIRLESCEKWENEF